MVKFSAEPQLQVIRIAEQSLHDAAPQMIDFLYIIPLLWIEMHNLSRLETTMKEQVGQTLLRPVGKQRLESLPHLTTLGGIFHLRFSRFPWIQQRRFLWLRVGPQCIQNSPVQTRAQVLQRSSKRIEFHPLGQGGGLPEVLKCLRD